MYFLSFLLAKNDPHKRGGGIAEQIVKRLIEYRDEFEKAR
jgi:hypothetical protein